MNPLTTSRSRSKWRKCLQNTRWAVVFCSDLTVSFVSQAFLLQHNMREKGGTRFRHKFRNVFLLAGKEDLGMGDLSISEC
jgi:hypothetical protein